MSLIITPAQSTGGGSGISTVTTATTTYTALTSDNTILCSTASSWTLSLYTAIGNSGRILDIVKTSSDTNTLTVDGNGSETINGATTVILRAQYDRLRIQSNGTSWIILDISQNVYGRFTTGSGASITGTPSNFTLAAANDTYGGFSSPNYAVPVSGQYEIGCMFQLTSNTWGTGAIAADIFDGSSNIFRCAYFQQATGSTAALAAGTCLGRRVVPLTAGQSINLRVYQTQSASVTLNGDANYNWWEIKLVGY